MGLTQAGTDGLKDNAVSLAKMAGGTDGQIITYDASGDPVAVGPGTDGQVLTSTGAGSPPAFEDAAAGGAALTGSTNNTVCTVTGANAIQGEANLVFDGTNLGVGTSPSYLTHIKKDTSGGAIGTKVVIENAATDSVNNNVELYLKTARGDFGFKHYNATESYVQVPDALIINTNNATSATQAVHIDTSQNVKVSNGNLVIGTSGKGIDFSANSHAGGMTSELLDVYEEGTFTVTLPNDGSGNQSISGSTTAYTKIGRWVYCFMYLTFSGAPEDNGDGWRLGGLPFQPHAASPMHHGFGTIVYNGSVDYSEWRPLVHTGPYIYFHSVKDGADLQNTEVVSKGMTSIILGVNYMTA